MLCVCSYLQDAVPVLWPWWNMCHILGFCYTPCAVHVTIISTGDKFHLVSNFYGVNPSPLVSLGVLLAYMNPLVLQGCRMSSLQLWYFLIWWYSECYFSMNAGWLLINIPHTLRLDNQLGLVLVSLPHSQVFSRRRLHVSLQPMPSWEVWVWD